jgi:hypothetical protein
MHPESAVSISPPVLVYLGMGLAVAYIQLGGQRFRGMKMLDRLQFLVRAGSLVLLWPLVLFLEKLESWLKSDSEGLTDESVKHS